MNLTRLCFLTEKNNPFILKIIVIIKRNSSYLAKKKEEQNGNDVLFSNDTGKVEQNGRYPVRRLVQPAL